MSSSEEPKGATSSPVAMSGPPRVWTVYAFFVVTLLTTLLASLGVLLVSYSVEHGVPDNLVSARLPVYARQPHVLLLTLCCTASVLIGASVLAARFSVGDWMERLSLRPQRVSTLSLVLAVVGAPALGMVLETLVLAAEIQPAGSLKMISDAILGARGMEIPLFVLLLGLGPGIGEELMFRGYIQTRLVRRHGPLVGIVVTSVLFGLMHMDALQSPLAGLLGVYIGVVAYKMGSVWPAILCHSFNNALSVVLILIAGPEVQTTQLSTGDWAWGLFALLVFTVSLQTVLKTKRASVVGSM